MPLLAADGFFIRHAIRHTYPIPSRAAVLRIITADCDGAQHHGACVVGSITCRFSDFLGHRMATSPLACAGPLLGGRSLSKANHKRALGERRKFNLHEMASALTLSGVGFHRLNGRLFQCMVSEATFRNEDGPQPPF